MPTSGRKTRSLEEQMAKLKQKEDEDGKEDLERELSFQTDHAATKKGAGGGTKTLAQRLSQSLRDPLRSKDYLGTVDKGEFTIDCHHHSKVIVFKNRKGYLSPNAMENLTELIQVSDTNWYERFSILKGGEEGFCAGLLPLQANKDTSLHRDLDMDNQALQYRLNWLIARSKRRRIAILNGPCLGAGAAMALSHWNPDHAQAFKTSTLGTEAKSMYADKTQAKAVNHLRIGTSRLQLSFQKSHFLGGYPGVGASFFLSRLRGHIGLYLALTGVRINIEDALFAGAATHYVQTNKIEKMQKALTDSEFNITDQQVLAIVNDFAVTGSEQALMNNSNADSHDSKFREAHDSGPPSYYQRYVLQGVAETTHLKEQFDTINRCFAQPSVDKILDELRNVDTEWSRKTLERLQVMSPTAMMITHALLRRTSSCDLDECVRTEWRLAHRMWPDLAEGVRAFEKDKDGKPTWNTPLTNEEVQALFQPIDHALMTPLLLNQDHLKKTSTNGASFAPKDRKF